MIEVGLLEGIRKLKERFVGGHPTAVERIDEWEKHLYELSAIEDYANLKTTQTIVLKLKARLKSSIVKRLIESETPEEKSLKYFISLMSPKYKEEMDKMRKEIEFELGE